MSATLDTIFHPAEGALLDLESLSSLASAPSQLLRAWVDSVWPGPGLVLSGLEPQGTLQELASPGRGLGAAVSPGVVRVAVNSGQLELSAGTAIVSSREGGTYLLQLRQPERVNLPPPDKMAARPVLVLYATVEPLPAAGAPAGMVARAAVKPRFSYAPEQALQPFMLPIAQPLSQSGDWAADLRRLLPVEHPAIGALLVRLDELQRSVWNAKPRGSIWDNRYFGDEWTRYQTVATAALQAARLALRSRPMHSAERCRVLEYLLLELQRSVEDAATELLQILGGTEAAGPYRFVRARAGQVSR